MPWQQGAGRVGDRVDESAGEVRGPEGEGGGRLPTGEEECRDGGTGSAGTDTGEDGVGEEGRVGEPGGIGGKEGDMVGWMEKGLGGKELGNVYQ